VRVALIADVHGNLLALDAVLAEIEREQPDQVICLGDVGAGPQARESIERVRSLGCPVVLGNWDAWFVDGMPNDERELERKIAEIGRWWSGGISDEDRDFIASFVPALDVDLGGGNTMSCFHGSPSSFNDIILSTTSEASLERMLDGANAAVYVGGHTHVQMVRRMRSALVVNPGSVGLPFRRWRPEVICVAPWAEYGLISSNNGRLDVELRRTSYDVDAFLRLSADSGMPHADWWVETWVLD
jgi:predicted phosphodiesterase